MVVKTFFSGLTKAKPKRIPKVIKSGAESKALLKEAQEKITLQKEGKLDIKRPNEIVPKATDEILKELKIRLNAEQLANIHTLLQRADLAKFAKSKPNDSENEESMTLAKQFVNNTKAKKGNE